MKERIQFAGPVSGGGAGVPQKLRHPVFGWLGLRPTLAQHTRAEHEALMKEARGARVVVEIGVAEGASAAGLREAMSEDGVLYLVDPFHLSRVRLLNFLKRAAKRAVDSAGRAKTVWIEEFSHEAVKTWNQPIDFLMIDGDHREEAVEQDFNDWSQFVKEGGKVVFHDARQFAGGWTTPEYGPLLFVNRKFRGRGTKGWTIVTEVDSLVVLKRES